jgi:Domain of unknown function (DUF4384)
MSRIRRTVLGFCIGATLVAIRPLSAEEDNTRAVKIIEAAPPSAPALQPPVAALPDKARAPTPAGAENSQPAGPPSPSARQIETTIVPSVDPKTAPDLPRKANDHGPIKIANSAELSVEMTPGETVSIGSRVSFRITSKKAGYIVLVDVDAAGKLRQIYPNTVALVRDPRPNANYIKPGVPLLIPSPAETIGGVIYVVSPPAGNAMVIAIWSEQPVQILDLPDVPAEVTSQTGALDFLTKWANELRIPDTKSNRLREAKWSFDAKFYAIQ